MLHSLLPICVLVLQGQQYFLEVGVVLIAYKGLEHLVTLLQAEAEANLRVGQLIKEVVSHNPNQGIVRPTGRRERQMNFKWVPPAASWR